MKRTFHMLLLRKCFLTVLSMAVAGAAAVAATVTSAGNGNWNSTTANAPWPDGVVPAAGDDVIIAAGNTVTVSATITQTGSVEVAGTLTCTSVGTTATVGSLTIDAGGLVTCSRVLTVNGATTITGTITFQTTARANVFNGDITLNSGAVWNEAIAITPTITGSLTNNATTFTASTGLHTFNEASGGIISGATATVIPRATFTTSYTNSGTLTCATVLNVTGAGVVLTNNGTITATTALSSTGGLTQGTTGILNLGGTVGITAFTASAVGNTVNYTGVAQTAKVTTYHNLTLSGSLAKTFATTPTVNGILSLEGTATITVTTGVVTYGANATLQFNKPAAYTATAEEWITPFVGSGGIIIANTGTITTFAALTLNAGVPLTINAGATLTTGATATWTLTVGGATSVSGTLTLANTGTKTFTGDVTINSGGVWNETGIATVGIAGSLTNSGTFTASTGTHTLSGAAKTLGGSSAISIPTATFTGSYSNNATVTVATLLTVTSPAVLTNNDTITATTALSGTGGLTQGTTGVLNLGGTAGITTLTASAVGNTVNYTGAAQTAKVTTYHNLTLSGSLAKTFATTPTVNGMLSLEGTATVTVTTGVVTYGTSATLQYNKPAAYTATTEEWITPFVATGGIIIENTGAITTPGAVQLGNNTNVPLNITSGATLTRGANLLTLHGDFINAGTLTSGAGGVTIAGTTATQSIDGFTTTGTVSMTKTSGTATVTGNVNGGAFTMNGNGGTLDLGAGLTHTFTGTWTRTNGTLLGNSSTLNLGGTVSGTGGTFTAGTGSVAYNGTGAQTVVVLSYYNLGINKLSGTATLGGATSVTSFTLTAGTFDASTFLLTATASTLTAGTLRVGATTWGGNYSFTPTIPSGVTIEYYNAAQTVATYTYADLLLSGSGTKTFAGATTISNNLSITGTAVAALGTNNHTSSTLTLGGNGQVSGTWGGTGSGATNINTTFFAANTGRLTVGSTLSLSTWKGTTSTAWATTTNWSSGAVPTSATNVTIPVVANQPTIGAAATCNNLTIQSGATLTIGAFTLTASGATTVSGTLTMSSATGTKTFTGAVTINSGGTFTENGFAATLSFGSDVTINGILTESGAATVGIAGSLTNSGTFTASTGTHTLSGAAKILGGSSAISIPTATFTGSYSNNATVIVATLLTVTNPAVLTNNGTITATTALSGTGGLTQGTTGVLNLGGTAGITTLTASAVGNTVNYSGAAQTAKVTTYHNLTLSGSLAKTFATTPTVNGMLSLEGTATVTVTTGVVTYGTSATLQYNKPAAYTATTGEWITPFAATGGIIIENTGAITTPGAVQLGNNTNVPLNITSGATLTPGANLLTLHGDFINAGTLTSGAGGVTIAGTTATQSIDGFTTTGTVSMTKTSGTATVTGNVNGGAFTMNGTGGTLDLGAGLTHTFTGTWTRTNGTLLGNSSTLNLGGTVSGTGGTFTAGTGSVNYNGTGAQTVVALNYFDLTISGARTTNSVTLANAGTIGVAGTFTPAATFTTGAYVITTSTVDYNGTSAQTITAFNYNNVTISGARTTNDITLTTAGTIGVAGTFTPSATFTSGGYVTTASLVDYNGAGAQTIAAFGYNDLTISHARTTNNITLASSGTIGVAGTLTMSAGFTSGSYVITNSTVDYNGAAAQAISAFNYYNLTISGTRTTNDITLSSAGTIGVAGTFSPSAIFTGGGYDATNSLVDYNGTGAQTIAAFDYNDLTISHARATNNVTFAGSGTIGIAGALTLSATFSSGVYITTNSTVEYNGAGAQAIIAFNYYNLAISGTRTTNDVTLPSAGTIGVAGEFDPSAVFAGGGYITTNSLVDYNGTGAQTIAAFNYHDLTISGTRTTNSVTLESVGTIGIEGAIAVSATFTSGSFINTNSTVDYNGAGAQTIIAFNYYNLTISGARTTNNVTLASSGTIGVAGTLTASATFTSGALVNTNSTIDYNGAGAQSVTPLTYNNLALSNGNKTFSGTSTINGNFVINSGATGTGGSANILLVGDWTNAGSFIAGSSAVELDGVPASSITGVTTFNALTINKADSATAVTLNNSINVGTLTMTSGTVQTGSNAITITGTRSGNGLILGTVTRTHTFSLSTPYAFEGPNTLITFTSGSTPTSVSVTVTQTNPSSPTMIPVARAVSVSTTGGSFTGTLRLHYEDSETNDLDESGLKMWKYSGGAWDDMGAGSRDGTTNYVEVSGLNALTFPWALGSSASSKTVVDVNGGSANAGDTLTYTVTIVNPYNGSKPSINVSDPLSSNFILVPGTISNSGGIAGQALSGMNLVGGTVTWSAFSLAGGASTTRTFQVRSDSTISPSQSISNTAQIDFGGNSEYVSVPIMLTNLPNLVITNAVDKMTPVPGDVLTYTLSVTNNGTSNATNMTLNSAIPNNTTFSADGYGAAMGVQVGGVAKTNTSDGDGVTVSGGSITVTIASISPGATTQIKFKTTVN